VKKFYSQLWGGSEFCYALICISPFSGSVLIKIWRTGDV